MTPGRIARSWLPSIADARAVSWRHRVTASVLAVACIGLSLRSAERAVHGLSQPYDLDQFRDVAGAQSVLDGRFPADPYYRGQTIWYNPLLPATVALVSRIRGTTVASTVVRTGPFLNALAPLAFFVMAASLVGPWPALAGLAALLYAPPYDDPAWATPSYSPWLFPSTFAASFFYVGILACRTAMDRGTRAWFVTLGVMLGVTFLAHTAPALVLGICAVAAVSAKRPTPGPRTHTRVVLLLSTAVVVSAPLLWSVVWHYHLHVVNRAPNDWVWAPIARWPDVLRGAATLKIATVAAGAMVLGWRTRSDRGAYVIWWWIAAAAILFCYGYVARVVGTARMPPLVPQFHFYTSLRSAGDLLIGIAVWGAAVVIVRALSAVTVGSPGASRTAAAAGALVSLAVVYAAAAVPGFRQRESFEGERRTAAVFSFHELEAGLHERLRSGTPEDSIVLATEEDAMYYVGPAGRSVVAVPAPFSNPFVPYDARAEAWRTLWTALLSHDRRSFSALARTHGVTHVLLGPLDLLSFESGGGLPGVLVEVSRGGGFALFEVHPDR